LCGHGTEEEFKHACKQPLLPCGSVKTAPSSPGISYDLGPDASPAYPLHDLMRIIEHYWGVAAVLMRCITVGPKALDGGLHS